MFGALNRAIDQALDEGMNANGRSARHVAAGVGLCGAALLLSALTGYHDKPGKALKRRLANATLDKPDLGPSEQTFSAVVPLMFLLLTFSGVRIWNAPAGPERSRTLAIWGGLQILHALSNLWPPRRKSAEVAANLAAMAGALVYAREARKVDPPAAAMIGPYASWTAMASLVSAEIWRRNRDGLDVQ
ncbi:MAG: hypothetical protein B7Y99_01225 [Caulobacterales bacterium 32-69-10]|nr:MAG: hypothetical protein B7Y99_01225 [Caulobacterales bacterium 32-69-10]